MTLKKIIWKNHSYNPQIQHKEYLINVGTFLINVCLIKSRINKTIFILCIQLSPYFFLCFSFWKSEHRKTLVCSYTSWFHVCLLSSNPSDVYVGLLILYSILTNVNLKIATARICQYLSNNPLKHEGKYFVLLYYHWTQYLHCFK